VKRALLVLGIGLAALVAVLLVRTAALGSRQVEVEPAPPLEVDGAAVAERLALAVHEPTISYQDESQLEAAPFHQLHTLLRVAYPRIHARLQLEKVSGLSLLYTWPGRDPSLDPVLFAAHLDVVPVDAESEKDWQHPPFRGVVEEGVVWGRGAMDDKASLICLFEAVEGLLAQGFQPERTVLLAIGHDEEVGGYKGALAIARLLAERGTHLAWVLDEGGVIAEGFLGGVEMPVAVVGVAEKGSVGIGLSIEAPGGHSSTPPRHTAIGDLAQAVVALENDPMPASLDGTTALFLDSLAPELPFGARVVLANRWLFGPLLVAGFSRAPFLDAMMRTTTAVTIFQSGVKENVLPIRASSVVNFRIHPDDDIETVVQHVRDTVDDDRIELQVGVRSTPRNPSAVSPVDSEAFVGLERSIRAVFPGTVVVPYLVLGGTDARHYQPLSDHVYRFTPFVYGRESLTLAHGTNERITVKNLVGGVRFYSERIRSSTAQP
jgi:carboxypeptidase PM20D1